MRKSHRLPAMTDTNYKLSAQRRELCLRVIDGHYANLEVITNRLFFLDNHFPPRKVERALAWLILSGNVGAKFIRWFQDECQSSDLEMHRLLLSIITNKDKEQIVAGKNFKV
jgi:hypothetical protein